MKNKQQRRLLNALIERDGDTCHYCGRELFFDYASLQYGEYREDGYAIEHVIAKANGGTDELDNLVLACRKCNGYKGAKDYFVFRLRADTEAILMFLMDGVE